MKALTKFNKQPLHGIVFALVATIGFSSLSADEQVDFNRDIRPILSDKCFLCHGPDDSGRQADLRLDLEESAHEFAFVPGSLADSEAWSRIISDDTDSIMPPPHSHKQLDEAEKNLFKRWIESGAEYKQHWSYLSVIRPEVPSVATERFSNAAIDAFVFQCMQIDGLKPSEEAKREVLIRRVTLDLTGLPPTIEEVQNFLADQSPVAYEKVVDRLLASPRYGERMALDWLDIARYGDTSVFHADGPREMWRWRDWVIGAYNDNMPFDQFTIKQLAGDLLPNKTVDDEVASGFNRNNASTDEGGAIAEEFRIEYAVDRVKTTSMVWLGLSMECAQCHDHKYDPISQEDYYKFFAFFNQAADPGMQSRQGNQEPLVQILDDDKMAKVPAFEQQIENANHRIAELKKVHNQAFREWIVALRNNPTDSDPPNDMVAHFPLDGTVESRVANESDDDDQPILEDQSSFSEGRFGRSLRTSGATFIKSQKTAAEFDRTNAFSYGCWVRFEGGQNGAPIARMNDGNGHRGFDLYLENKGVAAHFIHRWPNNALKVVAKKALEKKKWHHVFVTYDGSATAGGVKIFVNGEHIESNPTHNTLSKTIRTDAPFTIGRRTNGSHFNGQVDDVRVYDRLLSDSEVAKVAHADPLPALLALDPYWRTTAETEKLTTIYLERNVDEYQQQRSLLGEAQKEIARLKQPVTSVMVMQDVPQKRMTYVLNRGQYDSPNKEQPVEPGTPGFLPEFSSEYPQNRLGMAQWIVAPDHPLTSRVTVNRIWKMFFGTGIVETVEDFGFQGQWPTQPELLDWLANDFVENGWDVKRLVKQIVMSETYRQTSRVNSTQLDKDPGNRFLSRGPRFRLAGEFVRDQALAISGILNGEIGGPGVKPYQPPGLWNEVSLNGNLRFQPDKGEKLYRRSLYTYWKRSAPPPSMVIFDAPTREKCTVRRGVTNTPLQALVLMNDPQFVEASRMFAERILKEGGESFESKIEFALLSATAHAPSEQVVDILRELYENEKKTFASEPDRATKLLSVGEKPRDEKLDLIEHAAWTIIGSVIFNLDEVITRG